MNRTEQSFRNILANISCQIIITLFQFVSRTFFIEYLNNDYLSVNGLFCSILNLFNMLELGFGTAISIELYRYLVAEDKAKIRSYMNLFGRVYNIIGIVIFILGLTLLPFLKIIVSGVYIRENIKIIFILYLLNTVTTYFSLAYRTILISADQRKYYVTIASAVVTTIISILQILIIVNGYSFYIYLLIPVLLHFLLYFFLGLYVGKQYPYILENKDINLNRVERASLKKNVFSVLLYKLCTTCNSSADAIIASAFISTSIVGKLSNYTLVINAVSTIAFLVINAFTESIGNLNVVADYQYKQKVFLTIDYFDFLIFGVTSVVLLELLNPFIKLWIGGDYLFGMPTVLILVINYYSEGVLQSSYVFRNACGLFKYGKIRPIISLFLNVVLSVLFAKRFGIAGVIFATSISRFCTTTWFEPYLVYKKVFYNTPIKYYLIHLYYLVIFVFSYFLTEFFYNLISCNNVFMSIVFRVIISVLMPVFIFLTGTFFLPQHKNLVQVAKNFVFLTSKKAKTT